MLSLPQHDPYNKRIYRCVLVLQKEAVPVQLLDGFHSSVLLPSSLMRALALRTALFFIFWQHEPLARGNDGPCSTLFLFFSVIFLPLCVSEPHALVFVEVVSCCVGAGCGSFATSALAAEPTLATVYSCERLC